MPKQLTVSIVIPVYNDAEALSVCLEAVARQTVLPYEVIVVDNNSTDTSVAVAKQYEFVTLLHEPKQGVVHARNTGFTAATGDVIGRLDADSRIDPTWVETLIAVFTNNSYGAVSGAIRYHDVWLSSFLNTGDRVIRRALAFCMGHEVTLQGANMALRRTAWQTVSRKTCARKGLHEDFDLAIHLREAGFTNKYTPSLLCSTALRQLSGSWKNFAGYMMVCPKTYLSHGRRKGLYVFAAVLMVITAYPFLKPLYRNKSTTAREKSWVKLFSVKTQSRVNQATFVD